MSNLYKIVVRLQPDNKVLQIKEIYRSNVGEEVQHEIDAAYQAEEQITITVSRLT